MTSFVSTSGPPLPAAHNETDVSVDISDTDEENNLAPHVVDLLNRASKTIKEERDKTAALQREMNTIKQHMKALLLLYVEDCNAGRGSAAQKVADYLASNTSALGPLCGVSFTSTSRTVGAGAEPAPVTQKSSRPSQLSSRSSSREPTDSTRQSTYARKTSGRPLSQRAASTQPKPQSAARQLPPPSALPVPMRGSASHADPAPRLRAQSPNRSPTPPPKGAAEAGMIARLRRAMAPPPSKSQVGDVVDAMVGELKKEIADKIASGTLNWPPSLKKSDPQSPYHFIPWTVQIEKEALCAYRIFTGPEEHVNSLVEMRRKLPGVAVEAVITRVEQEGRKKKLGKLKVKHFLVNLTIDSGNLSVISGGGHVSLLQFLERKIHLKL